jgi:hypothetical protein
MGWWIRLKRLRCSLVISVAQCKLVFNYIQCLYRFFLKNTETDKYFYVKTQSFNALQLLCFYCNPIAEQALANKEY